MKVENDIIILFGMIMVESRMKILGFIVRNTRKKQELTQEHLAATSGAVCNSYVI